MKMKKLKITEFEKLSNEFDELFYKLTTYDNLPDGGKWEARYTTFENNGCTVDQLKLWIKELNLEIQTKRDEEQALDNKQETYDLEPFGDTYVKLYH